MPSCPPITYKRLFFDTTPTVNRKLIYVMSLHNYSPYLLSNICSNQYTSIGVFKISKAGHFAKTVIDLKPLSIFTKCSISYVWQCFEYTSIFLPPRNLVIKCKWVATIVPKPLFSNLHFPFWKFENFPVSSCSYKNKIPWIFCIPNAEIFQPYSLRNNCLQTFRKNRKR